VEIRTSTIIPASPDELWPLLTDSQMTAPGCFCLGLPRPVACELPVTEGKVGAERRCISDRGTVTQTITHWQPPQRLKFRMVSTDHSWAPCVEALEEDFALEPYGDGTRITRTSRIAARGGFKAVKEALFCIGLKRVHRYVFKNWRQQVNGA
jgi:hypothetical protein